MSSFLYDNFFDLDSNKIKFKMKSLGVIRTTFCCLHLDYDVSGFWQVFVDNLYSTLSTYKYVIQGMSDRRSRFVITIWSKYHRTIAIVRLNDRDCKNAIEIFFAFFQQSTFCRSNISKMPDLKE